VWQLVEVMAPLDAGARIPAAMLGGKDPLPSPVALRPGVLARECVRQVHATESGRQVSLMHTTHSGEPARQRGPYDDRKRHDALSLAFPIPDDDSIRTELDVLDPKPQAFQKPQSAPVEQKSNEAMDALQPPDHGPHLGASEDGREPARALRANDVGDLRELFLQNVSIEKENGRQRLILGRRADAEPGRQVRQEVVDLGLPHRLRVALPVEEDEPTHPRYVRLLSANAVVPRPDCQTHPIEEERLPDPRIDELRPGARGFRFGRFDSLRTDSWTDSSTTELSPARNRAATSVSSSRDRGR
jgi:hypothetical protein